MAATPPRQTNRRIHTPPTPFHDNYEPYSPRRSGRVASQRNKLESSLASQTSSHRSTRATTPTPQSSSTQPFSPPSSPHSPVPQSPISRKRRAPPVRKGTLHAHFDTTRSDSDTNAHETLPGSTILNGRGMLPTPAKTPRKRAAIPQPALASTARVLFRDRLTAVEDAMPDPKKIRRSKNALSLGHDEVMRNGEGSSKIEIFTDSKERVPEVDHTEDNPFLSRNSDTTVREPAKQQRTRTAMDKAMDKAVRDEKGLIFTFRGKKVFRQYSTSDDETEVDGSFRWDKANQAGHHRITRSSIKPRLLFPSEQQRREREANDAADEEATTDVDNGTVRASFDLPSPADERSARLRNRKAPAFEQSSFETTTTTSFASVPTEPEQSHVEPADEEIQQAPITKKKSPFAHWARSKAGSSPAPKSLKRGGEPLPGEASKRTRAASDRQGGQ